jgi:glycosyltransferase involved in cell wall biosynthesis
MTMGIMKIDFMLVLLVLCLPVYARLLNVALHAQVAPAPNQVVGSVITTDGLLSALSVRADIGETKVFYPFHYDGLTETEWDVVVIEGWFPMIHDFIQIVRSISSHPIVLYYCLDPSYPGMNDIITYDVDGYLTNSRAVQKVLEVKFPGRVEYIMLAADADLMSPNVSVSRITNALYLGAGGRMLEYKPKLLEVVKAALPFGLRLYGMGWDEVDDAGIRAANGGVLPRYEIANAYSGARVVLASTIQAQREEGMINNRIFEAMSCGALVLSDHFEALDEVAEGSVLFYKSGEDVATQLQWAKDYPEQAAAMGHRARELILSKHTWAHRAVQVMGLVADINAKYVTEKRCCSRPNCPTMLWVVASGLESHIDYNGVLSSHVYAGLCRDYKISRMSEVDFIEDLHKEVSSIDTFESVIVVLTPFDRLDMNIRLKSKSNSIGRQTVKQMDQGYGRLQKWSAFYLGLGSHSWRNGQYGAALSKLMSSMPTTTPGDASYEDLLSFDVYDVLLFRSKAEMKVFQHAFSLDANGHAGIAASRNSCGTGGLRCELLFSTSDTLILESSIGKQGSLSAKKNDGINSSAHKNSDSSSPWVKEDENDILKSPAKLQQDEENRKKSEALSARRRDPLPILVVCFWDYSELCSSVTRREMVGKDIGENEYHLLLLGGTFENWLSTPDTLSYSSIHRVIHVAINRSGMAAMGLIEKVDTVYLMHGDKDHSSIGGSMCNLDSVFAAFRDMTVGHAVEHFCESVDSTTLWPLALAARAGITIRTWAANDIYLSSAKIDDLRVWGTSHLTSMLQRSTCKAHGLGSRVSRIFVRPAGVMEVQFGGNDYLDDFVGDASAYVDDGRLCAENAAKWKKMLSHSLVGSDNINESVTVGHLSITVRLDIENFVPGRDGDICFQILLPHSNRSDHSADDEEHLPRTMRFPGEVEVDKPRTCLLRHDFPVVSLNTSLLYRPPRQGEDEYTFTLSQLSSMLCHSTLEVYARGNLFADTVDSVKLPLAQFLVTNAKKLTTQENIDTSDMNVLELDILL